MYQLFGYYKNHDEEHPSEPKIPCLNLLTNGAEISVYFPDTSYKNSPNWVKTKLKRVWLTTPPQETVACGDM